jgi:hypothetical protein
MFLYGGYSKVKEPGRKSEGKVHNDMWVLNLQPLATGGTPAWDRLVRGTVTSYTFFIEHILCL